MEPFENTNGMYLVENMNELSEEDTDNTYNIEVEEPAQEQPINEPEMESEEQVEMEEESKSMSIGSIIMCLVIAGLVLYGLWVAFKYFSNSDVVDSVVDSADSLGFKYLSDDISRLKYLK